MPKFNEIKYVRPDFKALNKAIKKGISDLKSAKNYQEFKDVYLALNNRSEEMMTMAVVASIRNSIDVNDKFYEDENKAISKASAKMGLLSKKMIKTILDSPYRKDIDQEFGDNLLKTMEIELNLISPKIIFDMLKEVKLTREYSKITATATCDFRGEKCNFYGLLKHMQSTDRVERKEAFEAWAKMYEDISLNLDNIYDKLIKIRLRKAKKLGFDDPIKYFYLNRGRLDYDKEDAKRFKEAVKKEIVPLCQELYDIQAKRLGVDKLHFYDESLVFPEGNAIPIGNKDELVQKALKMYEQLSPQTNEFFHFMVENELFDLETKPGKRMGGYCTFLPAFKAPFIFSNFNGTSADVDVLTHEAGHAFEAYLSSRHLPLSEMVFSTSEINEIHSMSMEHFTYPYMDLFFEDKADKYRYSHLVSSLEVIPYLVSVDEFQQRIYENPGLNAMERRKVWKDIENEFMPWRDYDGNEFLENGGFWMQKQHIFIYPFYYIDYALAQMCAYQFLIKSEDDKKAAFDQYLDLCKLGGSKGYFETLEAAHLLNPFKEENVKEIALKIKEIVKKFADKL